MRHPVAVSLTGQSAPLDRADQGKYPDSEPFRAALLLTWHGDSDPRAEVAVNIPESVNATKPRMPAGGHATGCVTVR